MPLVTMKEILADAQEHAYGAGFFNTFTQEMVRASISAAEELQSPVIIGTAESLLQYSELDWIGPLMLTAARQSKVPVAVHLDHTYTYETLMRALREGFGSVMFDGSRLSYEENVRISADIARTAHAMDAGVEAELGCVGGLEGDDGTVDENVYTDPERAARFVQDTGVDFLAVSIGTVHGVYQAEPKLNLGLLEEIRSSVSIPLVLHGGSGLGDDDIAATIERGICKVNVYTDVITAGQESLARNAGANYGELMCHAERAMADVVARTIRTLGSGGRA